MRDSAKTRERYRSMVRECESSDIAVDDAEMDDSEAEQHLVMTGRLPSWW